MRVLMFGWEFPPHISGGLGTACHGITSGLLNHGVKILFVVPKIFDSENEKIVELIDASEISIDTQAELYSEIWKGLEYIHVSSSIVPYTSPEEFAYRSEEKISNKQSSPFSIKYELSGEYGHDIMIEVARYALIAASIANDNYFDVIHAHDWLTYPAGITAKRISGKPLIIHVHATEFDRSGEHINQEIYEIEREGMRVADHIISVSEFTRNIIINRYGIDPSKISAIHNGVVSGEQYEKNNLIREQKNKIVTFLGRVTFQKGPDYFVKAAQKVLCKNPDVHFVMAGNGDMLNRMIKLAAELGISSRFHFTGFLNREDVRRLYALSDVYVMPSVSEPFGITPLEAIQENIPVIISKQSGVAEVLNHVIKVDFWDTDALADAINGILNYPSLTIQQTQNSFEVLQVLNWNNTAEKIIAVYTSLNCKTQ